MFNVCNLLCLSIAIFCIFGYLGAPLILWSLVIVGLLYSLQIPITTLYIVSGVLVLLNIPLLRRYVISFPLMKIMVKLEFLPVISKTEQIAIEAGTVWVDKELFSGKPNYDRILSETYSTLTPDEQAFIDGPCEELCKMVSDWEIYKTRDIPEKAWTFLKKEKFFGMIIPKEYGGLGFSPMANSAVVAKMSSRSSALGITVMVPNSLGPAELLVHYGTKEQKDHYLPRLAIGTEVPCFALTEPGAGSDAGAILANGVVFKDDKGEISIKLNWKKRYITLAAISTVLGLAFKLRDPDNILGKGADLGITCALIPTDTKGVEIGRRHDPLTVAFYNCPTEGHDVVIPISSVIGGKDGVGRGWQMLMESLAAGRGISLPASCTGGVKYLARVTGAYSTVRKQFGISIGKFEGIEEPLARIAGFTYIMEAARCYTCGGLSSGAKPAVITAIAKYHFTEMFRKVVNDAMDIMGGAAISLGPKNLVANSYFSNPISITVEGANILTRTLIIFGQGAIRCHPYSLDEIYALGSGDTAKFDRSFFGHVGHVLRNGFRYVFLTLTRGHLSVSKHSFGPMRSYYRKLSWTSAQFAFFSDLAMMMLGGTLKRKEKLTGRLGDVLSWMYLAIAVLKRYDVEKRKEDLPFIHWSMQYSFAQIQIAFEGIFANMGFMFKPFLWILRMNPIGSMPSDELGGKIARLMQTAGDQRDRLTNDIHVPKDSNTDHFALLEETFKSIADVAPISKKVMKAVRSGKLARKKNDSLFDDAVTATVITSAERDQLLKVEQMRRDVIQVDDYSQDEYLNRK
jgi:acyl-CoA dehydrogenase